MRADWPPALALALLLAPAVAAAAEAGLPAYDDGLYCARVGVIGMTHSTTTYDGCLRLEAEARTRLATGWALVPAALREHCELAATFAGAGSYAILAGCLERLAPGAGGAEAEPVGN